MDKVPAREAMMQLKVRKFSGSIFKQPNGYGFAISRQPGGKRGPQVCNPRYPAPAVAAIAGRLWQRMRVTRIIAKGIGAFQARPTTGARANISMNAAPMPRDRCDLRYASWPHQSGIGYSVRLPNDAATVRARSIKSLPTGGSSLFFKVTIATGVGSIGR